VKPVRVAAAEVLLAIEGRRTTLAAELETARDDLPDPRDRALLIEIASGTLRWQNAIDARLAIASRRAVGSFDVVARAVLRLGAYQLGYLTRVPAHAIVHESVEAVRALGRPRAAGFVNAVLRALIRRGKTIRLPARPSATQGRDRQVAYLSVTLSHPAWLIERWLDREGFDATEAWCTFNNTPPEITVRSAGRLTSAALLDRLIDAGADARPAPFVHDAIRLAPGSLGKLSEELRHELVVQDEAAQLVARVAAARGGERALDVCAAPGGKTLVMHADMAGTDRSGAPQPSLVAADYRPSRVHLLTETLRAAGLHVPAVALDARRPLPFAAAFDLVLLDAPCSGLGTLRRDPDLKWKRSADELPALAAEELLMLHNAAETVRPGGRIVYATCSSEPEENAGVVDRFLAADPRFARSPVAAGRDVPASAIDAGGCLSTRPFREGLDAFFAAVLVRGQT